ncbi:MAG: protein tyrosine phosphatase family protein [Candidatus Eisenbacteria bacterium]
MNRIAKDSRQSLGSRFVVAVLMLAGTLSCATARESGTSGNSANPDSHAASAHAPGTASRPAGERAAAPDSAAVLALLGGVVNASCPLPGVASGGQVSGEQVKGLARSGFRTVLDLRAADEPRGFDEAAEVSRAGLDYVSIPVTGASLNDATFDRVRELMGNAERHPVMVHCASGNRVGVVLLPWLVLDRGWSVENAVAVAEQGGMRQSPMRDRALAYIEAQRAKP